MRWCIGYLNRDEQLKFLKKAQEALANEPGRYTRQNGPASYIIVLDNVDLNIKREEPLVKKGQTIQNELYYQKLFEDAELVVHHEMKVELHEKYLAVKLWALY